MLNIKKYILKDGSINWHQLYFNSVPKWMIEYAPPLGDYNYAAYLYQPHKYFVALYRQIKWFIQRGYRGYGDNDTWSLDWYLAKWMPQAIRMIGNNHGHPRGMTTKGWKIRCEKMADGFEAAHEIQAMKYEYKSAEERAAWQRFNRGMKLFHKHFFSLWD